MLAMHDRARRAGGFPGQFEIKPNTGERLVKAGLVDFLGVRHTLDRRDQIIPGSESEIIVQVLSPSMLICVVEVAGDSPAPSQRNGYVPDAGHGDRASSAAAPYSSRVGSHSPMA